MSTTQAMDLRSFLGTSVHAGKRQKLTGPLGEAYVDWKVVEGNRLQLYAKGTKGLISIMDTTISITLKNATEATVELTGQQAGKSDGKLVLGHGGLYIVGLEKMPYGINEIWFKREGATTRFSVKKGIFFNFWINDGPAPTGNAVHDGAQQWINLVGGSEGAAARQSLTVP